MISSGNKNRWKECKLIDLCELISRGVTPSYTKNEEEGIIVLNQKCIRDNTINDQFARLTNPTKKKIKENKFLKKYDILVNSTGVGTLGRVAQIKNIKKKITVDSHVTIVRPKKEIDPIYLGYYMFMSQRFIEHLGEGSTGQTELSRVRLGEALKVKFPSLKEQKKVGEILSTLDEKIETNNQINKKLEEMAQTIFKHWFVDFEFPNEEGKPYKSSGGEMVESEMGMIPKGWEVGSVSDFGEVVGGATPSKKHEKYFVKKGIPWITPKDLSNNNSLFISNGALDITEEAYKSTSVKKMPKGTVLFSSRAPIGYMAIAKNEVTTNQGFKSIVPNTKKGFGSEYIYCWFKSNIQIIENRASGSTFKEISSGEIKKISAIVPIQEVLEKFKNTLMINFKFIELKEYEIGILKEIRDTLLPKLMSGEIRVPLE